MSKKIMIVCGSPRKRGNTNRIVGWVAEAARREGADVEIIDAANLNYETHGCTACMECQKSEEFKCVIDDEATPILARMPQADAVVLATPVYFHGPTAQLKLLVDRMYSLVKFTSLPPLTPFRNTTFALIATGGGPMDDGLGVLDEAFRTMATSLGFPFESLLVPLAPANPEEIERNAALKEKAAALGRKLAMA